MINIEQTILFIILGVVLAIVYSLRILVLMERRMARVELHVERMAQAIVKEEYKIETIVKPKTAASKIMLPKKKK